MSDSTDSTKKTEENKEVVEEKKVVDVEKMTMDELLSTKKTEVAHHDNNSNNDEMGTKAKSAEVAKAEDALFDAFDNDAELDDVNVGAGWADEGAPDIVPVASAAPEVASIKKGKPSKPKNRYTAEDVADEEAGLDC